MIAERTELDFDQYAFNRAVTEYGRRKTIEAKIREELKNLIGKTPKVIQDPVKYFYNELKSQNKELLDLGIALEKIPEMKGLNLSKLKELSNQFEAVKNVNSPNVDQFKTFAENEEEEAKFKACEKVIEALKELEQYVKIYPATVSNATSGSIHADMRKGVKSDSLSPNHRWIKDLKY